MQTANLRITTAIVTLVALFAGGQAHAFRYFKLWCPTIVFGLPTQTTVFGGTNINLAPVCAGPGTPDADLGSPAVSLFSVRGARSVYDATEAYRTVMWGQSNVSAGPCLSSQSYVYDTALPSALSYRTPPRPAAGATTLFGGVPTAGQSRLQFECRDVFNPVTGPYGLITAAHIAVDATLSESPLRCRIGPGTSRTGTVAHELGHVAGLDHEDKFPTLMNTVPTEYFSCISNSDYSVAPKPDPDTTAGVVRGLGIPYRSGTKPDLGVIDGIQRRVLGGVVSGTSMTADMSSVDTSDDLTVGLLQFGGGTRTGRASFTVMNNSPNPTTLSLVVWLVPISDDPVFRARERTGLGSSLTPSNSAIPIANASIPFTVAPYSVQPVEYRHTFDVSQLYNMLPAPPTTRDEDSYVVVLGVFPGGVGDADERDNYLALPWEVIRRR